MKLCRYIKQLATGIRLVDLVPTVCVNVVSLLASIAM